MLKNTEKDKMSEKYVLSQRNRKQKSWNYRTGNIISEKKLLNSHKINHSLAIGKQKNVKIHKSCFPRFILR